MYWNLKKFFSYTEILKSEVAKFTNQYDYSINMSRNIYNLNVPDKDSQYLAHLNFTKRLSSNSIQY